MRAVRWFGVVALWGVFIVGSWLPTQFESDEERQLVLLCERYEELLSGLPMDQIRDELTELAPDTDPTASLSEWLELCEEE